MSAELLPKSIGTAKTDSAAGGKAHGSSFGLAVRQQSPLPTHNIVAVPFCCSTLPRYLYCGKWGHGRGGCPHIRDWGRQMDNKQITVKVTLELDPKWASNLTREEVVEYIKSRLSSSLGFRGQVKKFSVVVGRTGKA